MGFQVANDLFLTKNTPTTPFSYSGASDWIQITGAVTDQVIFLVCDGSISTFSLRTVFSRPGSETITINWGDGLTDTISSTFATTTTHTYVSGGTYSTRGYNTWKITVSGQTGTRITDCRLVQPSTEFSEAPCGLLQAWYGDNTVTTMQSYFNEQNGSVTTPIMTYLEYVRVPNGITNSMGLERTFFNGCRSLQKVELPSSLSAITDISYTFYECTALCEVTPFPSDMTQISTLEQTFYNCTALQKLTFLQSELTGVTRCDRAWQSCSALGYFNIPALPNCTNWSLAFSGCHAIRSLNIPKLPSGATVTFSSTFATCRKLQTIHIDPNFDGTIISDSMFINCHELIQVKLPINCKPTTLASTFSGCYSLKEVQLPTNGTYIASFNATFTNCLTLQDITMPSTAPSGTTTFLSFCENCYCLGSLSIPSGYQVTSFQAAFQQCRSMTQLTLPQSSQLSLTTLASMCNACPSLQTVNLPTQMSGVTTLSATFGNCDALKSITLPSAMNSVTTMANFCNGCRSLQKVTLPTSMTSCTNYQNAFLLCFSLQSFTLPVTTSSNAITWTSAFGQCLNVKTITLPKTINNSTTAWNGAFSACYSLTGITNFEYISASATTATTYVVGTTFATESRNLRSLDCYNKWTKLELQGTGTGSNLSRLNSLRLRNNGSGQYGGTSPQINISFTDLSQAALVQVFNDLPTVTSKTINITSATGAAALTAGERAIATGKGWTITG